MSHSISGLNQPIHVSHKQPIHVCKPNKPHNLTHMTFAPRYTRHGYAITFVLWVRHHLCLVGTLSPLRRDTRRYHTRRIRVYRRLSRRVHGDRHAYTPRCTRHAYRSYTTAHTQDMGTAHTQPLIHKTWVPCAPIHLCVPIHTRHRYPLQLR